MLFCGQKKVELTLELWNCTPSKKVVWSQMETASLITNSSSFLTLVFFIMHQGCGRTLLEEVFYCTKYVFKIKPTHKELRNWKKKNVWLKSGQIWSTNNTCRVQSRKRGHDARSLTGGKARRRDLALRFYLLHFLARKLHLRSTHRLVVCIDLTIQDRQVYQNHLLLSQDHRII